MKNIIIIISITIITIIFASPTRAQVPAIDVASTYDITDENVIDGDILMYSDSGLILANVAYTNKIFGVLQDTPLAVYKSEGDNKKPVVKGGVANVNVTNGNGVIKKGDYITSSSNPGKGQKGLISGYVLGTALEDMDQDEGKISVAVRIEFAELSNTRSVLRLLDYFNIAAFQAISDPEQGSQLVKYIAAGLIILVSIIISLFVFGRSILKSIDAIGRNPLAKTSIQLSIVFTAIIILIIMGVSIAAALIILKL